LDNGYNVYSSLEKVEEDDSMDDKDGIPEVDNPSE
jgi:hypothetical protein